MTEGINTIISADALEFIYQEFTQFLKVAFDENFESFKKSEYVDYQENYKYSINQEAKRNLRSSDWKLEDIGTGKIQKAVESAMLLKVTHNYRNVDNNLINWRKINKFSNSGVDKNLEQLFFDLYKNKVTSQAAFEGLMEYFDYQTIAYLFFIKDYSQFLPISQEVFDEIISGKLHIQNFKTSRQISWENYKTFIEIIKQIYRFLRTKDKNATLLDAHSFLWILGKQREEWFNTKSAKVGDTKHQFEPSENPEEDEGIKENIVIEDCEHLSANQFTPSDIIWIKNVTNKETGKAYMNLSDNKFVLHFPNKHRTNLLSPQIGEIILLRQKINEIPVFTHLVTPIENKEVDTNEHPLFRYGRRVKLIAKTPLDMTIKVSSTKWNRVNFSCVSQGNVCEISNISSVSDVEELQAETWEKFRPFFLEEYQESTEFTSALINEIESTYPELTVTEGKLKLVTHFRRERNSEIVRRKKQQALESNILFCEVCNFSFREKYAVNFIECHHKTPISQTGITQTKLEDLALVCANCHRMLHKKIDGDFLSIEELIIRLKM